MTDETSVQAPAKEEEKREDSGSKKDPIRKITLIVLAACLVVFIWYILADRFTPYTGQARVQTVLVPIVPRVSGYLADVDVQLHSRVERGDLLFQLDRRPFELAIRSAEANVDQTLQRLGAQGATVKAAVARVGVSKAQLDRAQRNYDRVQSILEKNPGALSLADRDRAETGLAQAVERVASSEGDLEKAKQELGIEGPENPQLRTALVALEQAQLDLYFSTLIAPYAGVIESFNVDVGHYAQSGQPLATFVADHDNWIQADMRENNLANIKIGDRVELVLDVAPGRVFNGTVRSLGYGVSSENTTNRGDLPTISSSQGWLRDPQRFPVIIAFEGEDALGYRRAGGQVDVVIYTGKHPVLNAISWIRIRFTSLLSYVR
jgi:multidrug resistance efflux pump